MSDNLPHMDYRQHRRARRLVHECCNYDEGNCLLLDDGEPCVCVQSISFSLMCHWFRVAVLYTPVLLPAYLQILCSLSMRMSFLLSFDLHGQCPDCLSLVISAVIHRMSETDKELLCIHIIWF